MIRMKLEENVQDDGRFEIANTLSSITSAPIQCENIPILVHGGWHVTKLPAATHPYVAPDTLRNEIPELIQENKLDEAEKNRSSAEHDGLHDQDM